MTLENMISNRQEFALKVQQNAVPDMQMGIEIVSFNVQNFSDKSGIIEDIGIDNTMKIKKVAAISKADAERDIKIAQSRADKESNDARIDAEREIAVRNNELEMRKADLKKLRIQKLKQMRLMKSKEKSREKQSK